jgi:excisionase family DNA binding protein
MTGQNDAHRLSADELAALNGELMAAGHRLLTAENVAALLQVKPSWVYAEARSGRLPCVPVGRYKRFRWAAVEAWIGELERGRR